MSAIVNSLYAWACVCVEKHAQAYECCGESLLSYSCALCSVLTLPSPVCSLQQEQERARSQTFVHIIIVLVFLSPTHLQLIALLDLFERMNALIQMQKEE